MSPHGGRYRSAAELAALGPAGAGAAEPSRSLKSPTSARQLCFLQQAGQLGGSLADTAIDGAKHPTVRDYAFTGKFR
jgi:hypothetical protein